MQSGRCLRSSGGCYTSFTPFYFAQNYKPNSVAACTGLSIMLCMLRHQICDTNQLLISASYGLQTPSVVMCFLWLLMSIIGRYRASTSFCGVKRKGIEKECAIVTESASLMQESLTIWRMCATLMDGVYTGQYHNLRICMWAMAMAC